MPDETGPLRTADGIVLACLANGNGDFEAAQAIFLQQMREQPEQFEELRETVLMVFFQERVRFIRHRANREIAQAGIGEDHEETRNEEEEDEFESGVEDENTSSGEADEFFAATRSGEMRRTARQERESMRQLVHNNNWLKYRLAGDLALGEATWLDLDHMEDLHGGNGYANVWKTILYRELKKRVPREDEVKVVQVLNNRAIAHIALAAQAEARRRLHGMRDEEAVEDMRDNADATAPKKRMRSKQTI